MFKRTIAAVTILAAILCLAVKVDAADAPRHTKDDTWLVYWYVCGTDLEQMASADFDEMLKVNLSSNVKVLINANGVFQWKHHSILNDTGNGIYLYDSNGLQKIAAWKADMGRADTLKKFLEFGEENYTADHRILIFGNHGGLNGLCYDDFFDANPKPEKRHNLTYDDLRKVFERVYGNSPKKPFELIGFDTCLSGSYELANSIADFSRYMVGSEPSENGWFQTPWFAALSSNPSMNGATIGRVICDGTMAYYEENNFPRKDVNAFSVIDLSKMPQLRKAYEKYFGEAKASKQKGFSGAFARAAEARSTERYENLYVDLGTLAENTKEILPEASEELLNAIHSAVVYNRPGSNLNAHGISTYYPYFRDKILTESDEDFKNFLSQKSTPAAQKKLYKKLLNADVSNLQLLPLEVNANNNIVARLTPEQLSNVASVRCILMPYFEEGDETVGLENEGILIYSSYDDLVVDWKTGTVTEKFQPVYPTIDGHRIYMERSIAGNGYNVYEVPIILNGVRKLKNDEIVQISGRHTLQIGYNFSNKQWFIIGIGAEIENGIIVSKPIPLQEGDEITPLFVAMNIDTPHPQVTVGETFTYNQNSRISFAPIEDGKYAYLFQFVAPNGTGTISCLAGIEIENGEIISKEVATLEEMQESMKKAS